MDPVQVNHRTWTGEFQSISEPGKGKGCHSAAVTESLVTEVSEKAEEEGDHTKMHGKL